MALPVWFAPGLPVGPGADPACPAVGEAVQSHSQAVRAYALTSRRYPLLFRSNSIIIRQGRPPDGPTRAQMLLGRGGGGSWAWPIAYHPESLYQTNECVLAALSLLGGHVPTQIPPLFSPKARLLKWSSFPDNLDLTAISLGGIVGARAISPLLKIIEFRKDSNMTPSPASMKLSFS